MKDITVCASQILLRSSDALSHGKHQLLCFSAELAAPYRPRCSPRDSVIQLYSCSFDTDELESEDTTEGKQDSGARGRLPGATAQEEQWAPSQHPTPSPAWPAGSQSLHRYKLPQLLQEKALNCILLCSSQSKRNPPCAQKGKKKKA